MPDLRTLSRQQRRALIDQARQLAQTGTPPKDVQTQLGLSKRTYARWAKQFSFRKCDLQSGAQDKAKMLTSANAVLAAVRAALSENNEQEADRLLRTWKQTARRSRDLAALETEANEEDEARRAEAEMSNEELSAFLSDYAGRKIEVID